MNNLTQISIIRSLLLGIWIFILVQSPLHNLSYLPIEASDPWGIGKLIFFFNDVKEFVFQRPVLLIIQGLTITLCIFSLFLTRQKWLLIITVFFIWVIDAIVKSHNGFINHAQIAPLYMLTLFALFQNIQSIPLNKLISLTSREKGKYQDFNSTEYSFFLYFLKLVIIIPYSILGLERILFGGFFHGMELFTGNALEIYILRTSLGHSNYGFQFFIEVFSDPIWSIFLKLGFLVVTIFELLAIGVLFSAIFRKLWLFIIIPFHCITLLSMNIFFWENLLLIIAVFTINQGKYISLKNIWNFRHTLFK